MFVAGNRWSEHEGVKGELETLGLARRGRLAGGRMQEMVVRGHICMVYRHICRGLKGAIYVRARPRKYSNCDGGAHWVT